MISNKKILWLCFALMVVAQFAIPAQMIYSKNQIKQKGFTHKFLLEGIDPTDPFRGKYLILRAREQSYLVNEKSKDLNGEVYATFKKDSLGFSRILNLSADRPDNPDHLKVVVYNNSGKSVRVRYPFRRYYMNEHKAKPAETLVINSTNDSNKECYAEVAVYEGRQSLLGVKIDGVDIEELVDGNK